jgi:outer membrane protein TolC
MTLKKIPTLLFALVTACVLAEPSDAGAMTLEQAIDLAITRNERVAASDAIRDAAQARIRRARSFFFPDLEIAGTYTRRGHATLRDLGDGDTVVIQSRNAESSVSRISWTLFDARAFPLYRQAKLLHEASSLDARQERRLVAYEAADAFLLTLGFEAVLEAANRRRDFALESLEDARARFDAGLVSSNDVTRAELDLANAELEVSRSQASVATAYLSLGGLLATDVEGPLSVPIALLELAAAQTPRLPETTFDEALDRRFDFQAGLLGVEAAREFSKEPALRYVPSLDLAGTYRTTNESGFSGRDHDESASLTMTWSLYDGGEGLAERAERLSLLRAAELEVSRRSRNIEVEIRQAAVLLASEQASIRQAETAVRAARRNSVESFELYREGLATALERSVATVQLFEAEVSEVRARYTLALAFLNLRAAKGLDPLPSPVD